MQYQRWFRRTAELKRALYLGLQPSINFTVSLCLNQGGRTPCLNYKMMRLGRDKDAERMTKRLGSAVGMRGLMRLQYAIETNLKM